MVEVEEAQKKAKEEERVQRLAEIVQADAKKKKKAEVLVAWHKLLKLLLQHKVTVQIAWEEDTWRPVVRGCKVQSWGTGRGRHWRSTFAQTA